MERPPSFVSCSLVPRDQQSSSSGSISLLASSHKGTLFLCSSSGVLSLVGHSPSLDQVFRWQPHEASLVQLVQHRNVLCTVGDDASGVPILKLWNLDKSDKDTGIPLLIRSFTIQVKNKVFPVTALAATDAFSQIAVGLENGVVLLARGDLANATRASSHFGVLFEAESRVAALGFGGARLFAATAAAVFAFDTALDAAAASKEIKLDAVGADPRCAIVTPPGDPCAAMVVARTDGIYFYDCNGRGACFMIDGEKTLIQWFKKYLVVVSRPPAHQRRQGHGNTATSSLLASVSAISNNHQRRSSSEFDDDDDEFDHLQKLGTILTIYDLRCKLIAFQGSFEGLSGSGSGAARVGGGILSVATEWDELFVLTADQKIYRLEEKDMSTKLELLYSKNMYTLALSLISSPPNSVLPYPTTSSKPKNPDDSQSSISILSPTTPSNRPALDPESKSHKNEIHKRYADHLYNNSEFSQAMTQYLHTIGHLEPSYVIRKYLDAQRIHLLVTYLQRLHNNNNNHASKNHPNLATPDHTTLLINCYTKLNASSELDAFLRREDVVFDVDTAIRVCRSAGFYTHALYLADRFGVHEWYLHVMVEDLGRYEETVGYIMGLAPREMEACLRRYGHVLVREMVGAMVDVLVVLCTTERRVGDEEDSSTNSLVLGAAGGGGGGGGVGGGEEDDSMSSSAVLKHGMGGMVLMGSNKKRQNAAVGDDGGGGKDVIKEEETTRVPFAEDFIHLFVDMDEWCVVFLERVIEIRWGIAFDGKLPGGGGGSTKKEVIVMDEGDEASLNVICNTLLEMYLSLSRSSSGEVEGEERVDGGDVDKTMELRRLKALRLLQHPKTKYDMQHALILCQIHKYQPGVMCLYEKMHMYKEIVEHYMSNDEYTFVLESCLKFGTHDPSLWKITLSYFAERSTSSTTGSESGETELSFLLTEIDKRNLMSPLQVLQILSQHPATVTIGMIKPYLLAKINAEKKQAAENARLIASFQQETKHMRTLIHDLKTKPVVFQNSKCSLCAELLDLPSVHFLCKHSYHARCVSNNNGNAVNDAAGAVDAKDVEKECPICAPEHKIVENLAKAQLEHGGRHDVFLKKLESRKEDRFAVVAEYFGKDLFSAKRL
ncbi:hypothetical protein BDR26DRAFT_867661 [Obelidium mucronatum]|nr:hypothetical protein BDR26DRAFT_867661 [Obelidium mucronatum]